MDDKYLFPLNYKYHEKFMGIIEYSIILPVAVFVGIVALVLYNFQVDFFISFGIILVLTLPPLLILSVGINGQPTLPYLKSIIQFKRSKKIYIYQKIT